MRKLLGVVLLCWLGGGYGVGAAAQVSAQVSTEGKKMIFTARYALPAPEANPETRRARLIEHFNETGESLRRLRGPVGIYVGGKTLAARLLVPPSFRRFQRG